MTFKQMFKILSLFCLVIVMISLFLPNVYDKSHNYSLFELISKNGFKFFVLLILILDITAIASNLASISYDKNKYIPIVTLASSFLSFILMIFIKQLSGPTSGLSKTFWNEDVSIKVGAILAIICLGISFISNLVITIRSLALNKNDDDYVVITNEDKDEDVTSWDVEGVDDSEVESNFEVNEELLDEFKEK